MRVAIAIISIIIFSNCKPSNDKIKIKHDTESLSELENNDSVFCKYVYQSLEEINKLYLLINRDIIYSKSEGYEWLITDNEDKAWESISDSVRLKILHEGVYSSKLNSVLSSKFYNSIVHLFDTMNDPVNIGFILTKHEIGKTLRTVLSRRDYLNYQYLNDEDLSRLMSENEYVKYHKARIHIVSDSIAVYKTLDAEISFEQNLDLCYFILKRKAQEQKWLLDNIIICKAEEEEAYDIKIIGAHKPLEYFDFEEYMDVE